MKLATRVTLAVTTITAVTLATSFFAVSLSVYRSERRELDRILLIRGQSIVQRASTGGLNSIEEPLEVTPEPAEPTPRFVALYAADGSVLEFSGFHPAPPSLDDWPDARAPSSEETFVDFSLGQGDMRAVLLPVGSDGRLVLYAISRATIDSEWRFLNRAASVVFLAATLLASVVASWIAKRMSRDVQSVASVARAVAEGDLGARVGPTGGATETRMLATDIDHMIDQLGALVLSQRTFVSHAAHELRSPLATIRGELQLALRRERSAEEYRVAIEQALGDVEALAALAEELLVLARTQAKPERARPDELVAPAEVARETLHLVQGAATDRGVSVQLHLGEGTEERCLSGSPSELARALRNLVDNAVTRTQENGRVDLWVVHEGARVLLEVEDEGRGVPPGERASIFEPFFRGSKDQGEAASGAGLGLTIAREIARNHGGDVSLDTTYEQGARFVFWLPSALEDSAPERGERSRLEQDPRSPTGVSASATSPRRRPG